MDKTALLVVDLVNDFTQSNGKIYYETTGEMMPRVAQLIEQLRARGVLIVYIQQIMSRQAEQQAKHAELSMRSCCVEGSGGEDIDARLRVASADIVVQKRKMSGFFKTPLEEILNDRGIKNVVVIGTKTNCCVRATANDAAMRDFKTFVVSDCVSTNTDQLNEFHLGDIGKYIAIVLDSEELLQRIDSDKL